MSAKKQKSVKSANTRSKFASVFVGELLDSQIANKIGACRFPAAVSECSFNCIFVKVKLIRSILYISIDWKVVKENEEQHSSKDFRAIKSIVQQRR